MNDELKKKIKKIVDENKKLKTLIPKFKQIEETNKKQSDKIAELEADLKAIESIITKE